MSNKKKSGKPSPSNVDKHFSPGVRAMVFRLEYRHCHTRFGAAVRLHDDNRSQQDVL